LLQEDELQRLTQKMIALEFKKQGLAAFRGNDCFAKFLIRMQIDEEIKRPARRQLEKLIALNEQIGEIKIKIASRLNVETNELALTELNKALQKETAFLIPWLFPLSAALHASFDSIHQHIFPEGKEIAPEKFVSFIMFNFYGFQAPTGCKPHFYSEIYDTLTAPPVVKLQNEEGNETKGEMTEQRQRILGYYNELKLSHEESPCISAADVKSIMGVFHSSNRFNLRRKSSALPEIFVADSDEERYKKVQLYMQEQTARVAKGHAKKSLYQAIIQFYNKQNIDPGIFFAIQACRFVAPSASTMRNSSGFRG